MAKAFRVPWQDLTYATDRPQLVLETAGAAAPTVASAGSAGPVVMPRFDTYFANLVRDEAALLDDARKCCVVVPHIQTRLTAETEGYVEEQIGRAAWRGRVWQDVSNRVVAGTYNKKKITMR